MYEKSPDSISVNGKEYKIETDFRFWAEFTETVEKDMKKASEALAKMFMKRRIPLTQQAFDAVINQYYLKSFKQSRANGKGSAQKKKTIDFVADAPLISVAFLAQYDVKLEEISLNWWDFLRMFFGLTEEHLISKIIGYRSADTRNMSKEQARFYKEMQKKYNLNQKTPHKRRDFKAEYERISREVKEWQQTAHS